MEKQNRLYRYLDEFDKTMAELWKLKDEVSTYDEEKDLLDRAHAAHRLLMSRVKITLQGYQLRK